VDRLLHPTSLFRRPSKALNRGLWVALLFWVSGPADSASLTFQQGDGGLFSETDSTFIQGRAGVDFSAGGTAANFGSVDVLVVDDDPPGSAGNPSLESLTRILLRLPEIVGASPGQVPLGSEITNATITLTTTDDPFAATGASLAVHAVLVPWAENSVTWSSFGDGGTAGSEYEASPLTTFNPGEVGTSFAFDITSAVEGWSQGQANLGILITSTSDDVAFFYSDDHVLQSARPRLDIEFVPIPEPGTALLLSLGLVLSSLSGRRRKGRG
jgi:hypothetical protein